jgi:uncharacterized membrane protein
VLPAGRYKIEVVARGFEKQVQEDVEIVSTKTDELNLRLTAGDPDVTISALDLPTPPDPKDPPAPNNKGSVHGTISELSGVVVVKAWVIFTNTDTGINVILHSDALGAYSIKLSVGNYNAEVQADGYIWLLQESVKVNANDSIRLDMKLKRGQMVAD